VLTAAEAVPNGPPAVAHPTPEPTEEEAQALMRTVVPEAHQVPPENRAIETTRQAGEYVLPPKPAPKAKE